MRGKLARTHMKANVKKVVLIPKLIYSGIYPSEKGIMGSQPPKNNNAVIKLICMIWAYSAKKNKAKVMAEYSVLNPDTNSDSASAWSNGALFVSASAPTKNMAAPGNKGTTNQTSL